MARKRMFRLDVLETDAFMEMPLTTQALYFHLNLRADDDGFIGNPNQIVKLIGAGTDDLKLLIAKRFVIAFEDGVIVIKHWRMHNTLSSYRYKETNFIEDKAMLKIKENKAYSLTSGDDICDEHLIKIAQRQTKDNTKTTLEEKRREEKRVDKVSINIPPISPTGERNFDNYSNTANYLFIQGTSEEEFVNYIRNHVELDRCVTDWMEYKDERKPKSSNRYGKKGMNTLLNKIYTECLDYGIDKVIRVIEESISSNYQGIIWDKLNNKPKHESDFDAWARA